MDYTYEATGGIKIIGCAEYKLINFWYYKYAVGSILFSRKKALRGVYEKIAIKKVRFVDAYSPIYTDTYNGTWNENELIPYSIAVGLVEDYIILRNAQAEEAAELC